MNCFLFTGELCQPCKIVTKLRRWLRALFKPNNRFVSIRLSLDFSSLVKPNSVYRYVHPQILADLQRQDLFELRPRRECPHTQRAAPEKHLLAGRPAASPPSRVARACPQTRIRPVGPTRPARRP